MKLHPSQVTEDSLASMGKEACTMLIEHDYSGLAERFGYALSYNRIPEAAIEEDFLLATSATKRMVESKPPSIFVKYFEPNDTGLYAVVECNIPISSQSSVALELIITGNAEKHITLEGISGSEK